LKIAALDLGSNTTLMLIAEVRDQKIVKIYRDELHVTRMGQGVHASGKLHPEALARMDECLGAYAEIIKSEKPDRVLAMATSAARDVSNAEELFKIGKKHGIPIEIIPGHREAEITFSGATFEREKTNNLRVIDVGGGSTEVIGSSPEGKIKGVSVNVGSVRLTEMFVTRFPTPKNEVEGILHYADQKFNEAKGELPSDGSNEASTEVIAVAGTPTTLAAVLQQRKFSEEAVNGFKISLATMEQWLFKLADLDLEDRMKLTGMDPKRADVIVAGTGILITALKYLGASELTVSTHGVRYGVALFAASRSQN
jgi:exopolyphosphatase / guanosine-5'-triphosphate,3'-diphosphate pyrophosphatase